MANSDKPKDQLGVQAEPPNLIPAYASKVGVTKSESGNTILSFIFDLPGEPGILIKRIMLDDKITDELVEILKTAQEAKSGK